MSNNEIDSLLARLNEIFNLPDGDKDSSPSFGFCYKNKTKRISGTLFNEYFVIYHKLYELYKLKEKKISFNTFHDSTRVFLFEQRFNDESIKKWINSQKLQKYICYTNIYGITIPKSFSVGCYTFLQLNEANAELAKAKIHFRNSSFLIESFINENSLEKVCVRFEIDSCDRNFASQELDYKADQLIYLLRFLYGTKEKVNRIGKQKVTEENDGHLVLSDDGIRIKSSSSSKLVCIPITSAFFSSEDNELFTNLFLKAEKNNLELALMKSIEWIGMSIIEQYDDIAITEIVNGFETVLRYDDGGPLTKSIQGQISENVALLVGNSLEERKQLISTCKDMYRFRSSVAHGSRKEETGLYYEYFGLLRKTMLAILKHYSHCSSVKQLNEELENFKLR